MQLLSYILYLSSTGGLTAALVPVAISERAIGQSCITLDGAGTCQNTADCTTQGFSQAGFCPGAADIQCCVKRSCSTSSGGGTCMNTSSKCGGSFVVGACPGDSSIQCCVSAPSPPPSSPGNSGQSIVDAAVKETDIPYVWGGGDCSGPSKGGFDCSGLTQYSICQALDITIPRTAQDQYHSSLGKHIPRSKALAGDLLFWAKGGDCVKSVSHVGIFVKEGFMFNAAHTGTLLREQPIWTSYGGESICPDAVRFW